MVLTTKFVSVQRQRLTARLNRYALLAQTHDPKDAPPHLRLKQQVSIPYIRIALKRIADGTYGICCDCGDPIRRKRLLAVPGAIRCTRCQTEIEADHAHA